MALLGEINTVEGKPHPPTHPPTRFPINQKLNHPPTHPPTQAVVSSKMASQSHTFLREVGFKTRLCVIISSLVFLSMRKSTGGWLKHALLAAI